MATAAEQKTESKPAEKQQQQSIRLDLIPRNDVAQTIYANQVMARPGQGVILVDFGFAEPAMIDAIARRAKSGQKVPPAIEGNLGARLAISAETAAALYGQLGQLLQNAVRAATANAAAAPNGANGAAKVTKQ